MKECMITKGRKVRKISSNEAKNHDIINRENKQNMHIWYMESKYKWVHFHQLKTKIHIDFLKNATEFYLYWLPEIK